MICVVIKYYSFLENHFELKQEVEKPSRKTDQSTSFYKCKTVLLNIYQHFLALNFCIEVALDTWVFYVEDELILRIFNRFISIGMPSWIYGYIGS